MITLLLIIWVGCVFLSLIHRMNILYVETITTKQLLKWIVTFPFYLIKGTLP